jgi:hypothetical protein
MTNITNLQPTSELPRFWRPCELKVVSGEKIFRKNDRVQLLFPLPGGEGQGEGGRQH